MLSLCFKLKFSLSFISLEVAIGLPFFIDFGAAILMLQKRMSEDMKDLSGNFHLHIRYLLPVTKI